MEIDQAGLDLLVQFEGLKLHPYNDEAGVPTIGIGTTFYPDGRSVRITDPAITKEQAYAYAKDAIDKVFIPTIESHVTVPLNQSQVNSLISFTYNEGTSGFSGSHLLQVINAGGSCADITAQFMRWVYVNHVVNAWQVHRRTKEAQVYCS